MRLTFRRPGDELDPELLIAHRRLMALDRAWRSDLRLVGSATRILAAYQRAGYHGQEQDAQQDLLTNDGSLNFGGRVPAKVRGAS